MSLQNNFAVSDKVHPMGANTRKEKSALSLNTQGLGQLQQLRREQLFKG